MQELARMAVFAVVAEQESISRAAERLGLSKSAVSKQITALEESLDLRLLFRSARRTRLTNEGRRLQPLCAEILQRYFSVRNLAEQLKGTPGGSLSLDMPGGIAKYLVLDRLRDFRANYPNIELNLRLRQGSVQDVSDDVDIAIIAGNLPESSVVCRRLGDITTRPFATPQYLEQYGEPQKPDDLHQHSCIVTDYRTVPETGQWTFMRNEEVQTLSIDAVTRVNDSVAAKQLVMNHTGISMLQDFTVAKEVASGDLQALLPEFSSPTVPVYVIYPERKNLSPTIRVMVDFLCECFSSSQFF